jgi:branched-chain amino acid transport system substrate-binding protein
MDCKRVFKCLGAIFLILAGCLLIFSRVGAEEKKEILIGTNLSLTGMLAMDGGEQRWAYDQAVADVNKAGGIYIKSLGKKLPVKLVVADDESDPGKTAAAVEKLIKLEKVDLLLSAHSTPQVIPSCVTAEKYKMYYHGTACIIPVWLPNNFKWSTDFWMDMDYFCNTPFEVWNSLPASDKIQRPALLMEDTLDGRGLGEPMRAVAEKHGYKWAFDEPMGVGAKDYSSQVLKLKSKGVDAIIIFCSPTDAVTFIRQMKENKFSVKYFHGIKGTWTAEFWKPLGKDAQYILCDGFWSETFPFPGCKELGERFYKKYGKYSLSTGLFYAVAQILWSAIEKAGTLDSEKVREAVLTNEFKGTMMGDIKYKPDGTALFKPTLSQWWDEKQRLVYPFSKDTWKLRLAPPWDKR